MKAETLSELVKIIAVEFALGCIKGEAINAKLNDNWKDLYVDMFATDFLTSRNVICYFVVIKRMELK